MELNSFMQLENSLINLGIRTKTRLFKRYRKMSSILKDVSRKWSGLDYKDKKLISKLFAGTKKV